MTRARWRRAALALLCVAFLPARAGAIVGGVAVPGSEADAVVLVLYMSGSGICSGTLIEPDVVLTAASCLPDLLASNYTVLGGGAPLSSSPLFTIPALAVHRHPDYDPQTAAHNVGVIELGSAAPVTPLPWLATDQGFYEPGLTVLFLGYGVTDAATQSGSGVRRGGSAPITEKGPDLFLIDATLGQSPCSGDTGGPALTDDLVTGNVAIGITSFGDQDCLQFAAFTRTDTNADFISIYTPEPSIGEEAGAAGLALALAGTRRRASPGRPS